MVNDRGTANTSAPFDSSQNEKQKKANAEKGCKV
jgi:hypothetical protein